MGLGAVLPGNEAHVGQGRGGVGAGGLTGLGLRLLKLLLQKGLPGLPQGLVLEVLQPLELGLQAFHIVLLALQVDLGPLQLQAGKGGVVAQQLVALFHRLALGDVHLGHGLALRQVDFLQLVGGDGAAALGAAAPLVGGHKAGDGIHVHRLAAGGTQHGEDAPHRCHHRRGDHHAEDHFFHSLAHTSTPPERMPSRMVRVIWAWRAMPASWVIIIMVAPLSSWSC